MFEKTEVRRQAIRECVELTLVGGDVLEGEVFVRPGQRVSDLFNDERAFFPCETLQGEVRMIAKSQIASARMVGRLAEPDGSDDPYEILRIERGVSASEVRAAWMKRVKACHPDRLAALDLDPEIVLAARRASQRINAAYDQIVRERRNAV